MLKKLIFCKIRLGILDQRILPFKTVYLKVKSAKQTAKAIKNMVTRGAPLIGCAAAYGYALELNNKTPKSWGEVKKIMLKASKDLKASRPTAKALFYAVNKLHNNALEFIDKNKSCRFNDVQLKKMRALLNKKAEEIYREDVYANEKLSVLGAKLIEARINVMTICNAGSLATAGIGTALGIIHKAHLQGKINKVYVCETRPYLQGSRLTMFELMQNKIPCCLITDNMAAHIMKTCNIGAVIAGADRIASNGDTANKIGTYMLSILARYHKIPFYIAAPVPTFDLNIKTGKDIVIEERSAKEVCFIKNVPIAPRKAAARHPAFDITPAKLITAIITEKAVIKPVNKESISKITK